MIADALVLTLTRGVSLQEWERLGLIERERALIDRLAPHYRRVLLVTGGGNDDAHVSSRHNLSAEVVCGGASPNGNLAAEVAERLGGAASAVVRTNQLEGASLAVSIARQMREVGTRTGLIIRGGYLWSRFVAADLGADSIQARDAAAEEQEACQAADLVIGTTPSMVSDLAWRYGLGPDWIRVIPNFVELNSAEPRTPRHDSVLYAGQLVARKRVDLLIEAVARIRGDVQVTLSIIGDGPERTSLERLAAERGVRATFESRVPHPELRARMRSCAVYAQCSALEGHPKTVLEALSEGAAVLVTDSAGLGDVIEDGVTGLRVRADAVQIARALEKLIRDPTLRGRLGNAARHWAEATVSLDRVIDQETAAHRTALDRSGSGYGGVASCVRWQPDLVHADPRLAAAEFDRSAGGLARRLPPRDRAVFLMALDSALYQRQGRAAIECEGGLHPKHRLMRYHDFFVDRVSRGDRVIDLGCGVGALSVSLAMRSGARVVGMDMSESVLEQARRCVDQSGVSHAVRLVKGDITRDRAEGEFDVIVLSNVLEHLRDRPLLLRTYIEWYRPRRLLIRVPSFDRDWRVPFKKELGVEWRLDDTHETEYTRSALEADLREGRLQVHELIAIWGEYWVDARPCT
ncbi:MAG: glycosyltransferase [Phycisphaeraceae bacterium]|nr:glycosyltransferase [Phycisphaeraceae bacterium]